MISHTAAVGDAPLATLSKPSQKKAPLQSPLGAGSWGGVGSWGCSCGGCPCGGCWGCSPGGIEVEPALPDAPGSKLEPAAPGFAPGSVPAMLEPPAPAF